MGVRILYDRDACRACLYDSVTETAFGPCFVADDADIEAESFMAWLECDARILPDKLLRNAHDVWHKMFHDRDGELLEFPAETDESLEVLAKVQQCEIEFHQRRKVGA